MSNYDERFDRSSAAIEAYSWKLGVWARTPEGVWHQCKATYPADADTACGVRVRAVLFVTGTPNSEHGGDLRPTFCPRCVPVGP